MAHPITKTPLPIIIPSSCLVSNLPLHHSPDPSPNRPPHPPPTCLTPTVDPSLPSLRRHSHPQSRLPDEGRAPDVYAHHRRTNVCGIDAEAQDGEEEGHYGGVSGGAAGGDRQKLEATLG
jgi:hypothetical protein